MRRPFIAGNWKMNTTLAQARDLAHAVVKNSADLTTVDLALFVPSVFVHPVGEIVKTTALKLGGQNAYFEESGAFTGEVSMNQLKSAGAYDVLVGHSERRQLFGETNDVVAKKTQAALAAGIHPMVCVGETLDERKSGSAEAVVEAQLKEGLAGISDFSNVSLAYEPVWAIGTGETATPEQAQDMHQFIRTWIKDNIDSPTADTLRVLYGGSVKPENAADLLACPDIDGALVGGASLKADSFLAIARAGQSA